MQKPHPIKPLTQKTMDQIKRWGFTVVPTEETVMPAEEVKSQNQPDDLPYVSLVPLGGLGEIGMNMMMLQSGEDLFLIDAGLMFPEEEMLGIDIVLPDFTYLLANQDRLRAILITHGHEDHTGALPFILQKLKRSVPIYGTTLTLGFIREKLKEFDLDQSTDLRLMAAGEIFQVGEITVEPVRVSHSIVEGVALALHTPAGIVLHSGDFKIDQTPIEGETTDFHKLAELSAKGVLVLLSDSTNAERSGFTPSEREVGRSFTDIFRHSLGRIIIATFASNIHRIQQAIDVAEKFDRKIAIAGKSMVANTRIAQELKVLRIPEGMLIRLEDLAKYPHRQLCILTTGSQGEPLSVLSRLATNEMKHVKIQPGDTVIISARVIPGNERCISRTINNLFRRGADVHYQEVSDIHVSGHASQEELKLMLNLVRPKFFVPIHGEYRHLIWHARLAQLVGIPRPNIFIAEDGDILEFTQEYGRFAGKVAAGRIFIDGKGFGDVGNITIKDRQILSQDGVVTAVVVLRKDNWQSITGPEVISRGYIFMKDAEDLFADARLVVARVLEGFPAESIGDRSAMRKAIRTALQKYFFQQTERRPMILPIIMEIESGVGSQESGVESQESSQETPPPDPLPASREGA
jgi:ribonuclease J